MVLDRAVLIGQGKNHTELYIGQFKSSFYRKPEHALTTFFI